MSFLFGKGLPDKYLPERLIHGMCTSIIVGGRSREGNFVSKNTSIPYYLRTYQSSSLIDNILLEFQEYKLRTQIAFLGEHKVKEVVRN